MYLSQRADPERKLRFSKFPGSGIIFAVFSPGLFGDSVGSTEIGPAVLQTDCVKAIYLYRVLRWIRSPEASYKIWC